MSTYKYQAELDLYRRAKAAAVAACNAKLKELGGDWFPCGFADVVIKPARGSFVAMLKDQIETTGANPRFSEFGFTSEYGGWKIYNPSGHPTQSMHAKKAGADAFAAVLREAGINASAYSMID